ncbi:hypothetical protein V6615_11525 [Oscillospiraceae bacterium PP1C4]
MMLSAQALANFWISLEIMWMGMFGIFTVIVIIMAMVSVLTKFSARKNEAKE